MLEKIGSSEFGTLSRPDETVLRLTDQILASGINEPVYYEIGVGIGATALPVAEKLNGHGKILLFSRESDVVDLAEDLALRGYVNVDANWGSPSATYSGYHFELARGFVSGQLPEFDLAFIDGGHVFHLDAPATAVLKELARPGAYLVFDDWHWTLKKSPTQNPTASAATARNYDLRQIETEQVQLVCKVLMDTDPRFEFVALEGSSAIYRRVSRDNV